MSITRTPTLALAAIALMSVPALAGEATTTLPALAASTTDLGHGSSALTYWVDRTDGRHVITTVDITLPGATRHDADRHEVVRFAAVLSPGQAQEISIPSFGIEAQRELRIERRGDEVRVSRVATPSLVASNNTTSE